MTRWSLAGVGLVALGCGSGAAVTGVVASTVPARPRAEEGRAEESPLGRRVQDLARQLADRNVTLVGIAASGFITRGTEVTTPFEVPAGRCLSIVALGSTGIRDLDAHLFAPNGDLVVEDVETDPHPTVQLCATEPRRVYHVMEAYEGQGAYVVASFVTDRAGLEQVARAVGGHPGTAVGGSADASPAERSLSELREGIARRGFTPLGDVARADFAAAGAMRFPFAVTPDRCYTFAAFADGAISDADLSVFDADGDEIARDVRSDRDAFVQLCPAAGGSLAVEVRARPGVGSVLLQAFAADAASLGGANTLWLGERTAWGASAVPLAEAAAQVQQALGALGYNTPGRATGMTFAPGELREVRVAVEGGRCTALAAVAGRGLGRLGMEVFDAQGDLVARGRTRGAGTVAAVCPAAREELRVVVTAEVGAGDASVQSFGGAAAPAWAAGVDRVAVSEAIAALWGAAAGGWAPQGTPERLRVGARAQRVRDFDRAAGRCVRWALTAGRGLPWVSLVLRAAGGATLGAATGEGTAVVTRCGAAEERARVELRTEPSSAAEVDAVLLRWERSEAVATGP